MLPLSENNNYEKRRIEDDFKHTALLSIVETVMNIKQTKSFINSNPHT